jgi:hypothetical protein
VDFGIWERLIALTSLKKTLGRSQIDMETLQTIVTEIETILDDRPLTYSLGPCVIPWAFHDHFGFLAELYSLKGADSKKHCRQFFRGHLRP